MPAVSTKRIGPASVSTTVSIVSRVVPGMSWTTERSSPISRLNSVDLPDVGAAGDGDRHGARVVLGRRRQAASSVRCRASGSTHQLVEHVAGAAAVEGADRVRVAQAEAQQVPDEVVAAGAVDLVGDHEHGRLDAAQDLGDPVVVVGEADGGVDHEEDGVGLADGLLALLGDLVVEGAAAGPSSRPCRPGRTARPFQSASTSLRSRVTPGRSSTMASRRPMIRLTRVDLPTLGRPTMATVGRPGGRTPPGAAAVGVASVARVRAGVSAVMSAVGSLMVVLRCRPGPGGEGPAEGGPSVGTTSTGRGRSAGVVPSRKRPPERHTSGSR